MRRVSINTVKSPVRCGVVKKKVVPAPWTNTVASDAEIRKRRDTAVKLKEIGVDVYSVDGLNEHENPYRTEAVMLITNGKVVTNELKQKIQEYDKQHKQNEEKKDN